MQMEMAGQRIVYRDLNDLRTKLSDLLQTFRKQREAHDEESERIRKQEKSVQRFLGASQLRSDNTAPPSGVETHA